MRILTMKISISFIIAIMGFVISPATIAETQLNMLDSSANNLIIDDENIITVSRSCHRDCRIEKRRCFRYCDRRYDYHSYRYDRCARRCDRKSSYCHRDCRYDDYRR
jgi:hypothetical protein